MLITVDAYGSSVGKKSERLVVKYKDGEKLEKPFFDVEQVVIASNGVSISSDAVQECLNRGIQIIFSNRSGQPYGLLSSPEMNGTIKTRRAQLLAYNTDVGLAYVKSVGQAKIQNQINTIKYFLRSRKDDNVLVSTCLMHLRAMQAAAKQLETIEGENVDHVRDRIMAAEGQASRNYWQAIGLMLPPELEFAKREHQGSQNVANMLLNYGYGILYSKAWSALTIAGLDPYGGFLHVDRPGKPSLVLDFVEEFRQSVVDRVVWASVLRGYKPDIEDGFLSMAARRELAERIDERLKTPDRYNKKSMQLQFVISSQARRLAGFLRGEGEYKGHIARW